MWRRHERRHTTRTRFQPWQRHRRSRTSKRAGRHPTGTRTRDHPLSSRARSGNVRHRHAHTRPPHRHTLKPEQPRDAGLIRVGGFRQRPPHPYTALPVWGCGGWGVVASVRVAVFAVVVVGVVRSVWGWWGRSRGRRRSMSGWRGRTRAGVVVLGGCWFVENVLFIPKPSTFGRVSGLRGRARPAQVVVGRTRTFSRRRGRPRVGGDVIRLTRAFSGQAGSCSGWRGRHQAGRGVFVAAGRSARGRGLNLHGAGSPRQNARPGCTWLPTAPAPGSGTVCCATPGLLRRFVVCYATSGLTTPVNRLLKAPEVYSRTLSSVVNAQPTHQTPHPTPPHAMSQGIGSTPAAAQDNHHTPKPEEPLISGVPVVHAPVGAPALTAVPAKRRCRCSPFRNYIGVDDPPRARRGDSGSAGVVLFGNYIGSNYAPVVK